MQYPTRAATDWAQVATPGFKQGLQLALRDAKLRLQGRAERRRANLQVVRRDPVALQASDVVLICVLRNAVKYLPSFLSHYRSLGVHRFAFVDDQSDDGTRTLLLKEHGVDVFESTARYGEAGRGLVWRDMLVELYGKNRWYVSVDSDEYLVFPDCERQPLRAFIDDLQTHQLKRSLAVMLDIYPEAPIGQASAHLPLTAFPTIACPLHDSNGYSISLDKKCTAVRGGPRLRRFGVDMRLTKFPVIFVDRWTQFSGSSAHAPLPLHRNYGPVHAVLLHYKFTSDAVQDFQRTADQGQHWAGAGHYKQIVGHSAFDNGLDLRYEGSARFEGSRKLVDTGFMQDLRSARPDAD